MGEAGTIFERRIEGGVFGGILSLRNLVYDINSISNVIINFILN